MAVEALANNGLMSKSLAFAAAQLKYVPTVERTIERPHSIIKTKVGKRTVGPPYVSLSVRGDEIKTIAAASFPLLLAMYEKATRLSKLAAILHLQNHPRWRAAQEGRRQQRTTERLYPLFNRMVYRCDLAAMFQTMRPVRIQHDRSLAASVRRFRQQAMPLHITSLDTLQQRAAIDHLQRQVMLHASLVVCRFTTKPRQMTMTHPHPGSSNLRSILGLAVVKVKASVLGVGEIQVFREGSTKCHRHTVTQVLAPDVVYSFRPPRNVQLLKITDAMSARPAEAPDQVIQEGERTFFRLVHGSPSDMRTAKGGAGYCGRMHHFDMAIAPLHSFQCASLEDVGPPDMAAPHALLSQQPIPTGGCIVHILRGLQQCSYESLSSELLVWAWQTSVPSTHALHGFRPDCGLRDVLAILDSFVVAGAFAASGLAS